MNKKLLAAAAGVALLMSMPVMADEAVTLSEKIDRVDEIIYGSAQSGSLIHRVDQVDNVIYGVGNSSASGLDNRISNLYVDVVKNDDDTTPSISTRTNAMEYYLTDEVQTEPLTTRIGELETKVYGKEKKGALDTRMAELEKAVYGDQHYEMKTVELPANTVFKIALNDDVNSKLNQVGDEVTFTVQEDVMVGDVLVLPRGSQGSGVVTKVSRPKSFGRSGQLDISFDQVFSVDDESIPTVLGPESKEKLKMEAAAVGASTIGALALGPIGLVGGIFVKGKDVNMPAGSELYIQTSEAVTTKGLVLADGAPNAVIRKRVVRSAAVTTEAADNQVAAASKAEETTAAKTTMDENAKAELESVRDKNTNTTEATNSSANEEEAASVVIVRNDDGEREK
ncbi:MAG TPA: hypothetical protein DDY92_06215 [Dialister sp.]|nr:hypothetical protein [Dialister sp.]